MSCNLGGWQLLVHLFIWYLLTELGFVALRFYHFLASCIVIVLMSETNDVDPITPYLGSMCPCKRDLDLLASTGAFFPASQK